MLTHLCDFHGFNNAGDGWVREHRENTKSGSPDETGWRIFSTSIIVALTGLVSDEDQKRAFATGVDHFVTKPLRFKNLKQILSEWNLDGAPKGDQRESVPV
jgi:CheY-like chemotaxis protein